MVSDLYWSAYLPQMPSSKCNLSFDLNISHAHGRLFAVDDVGFFYEAMCNSSPCTIYGKCHSFGGHGVIWLSDILEDTEMGDV